MNTSGSYSKLEKNDCFLQVVEAGPLRASVKIKVPLGEHGDLTVIATVLTETPYVSFKADVRQIQVIFYNFSVGEA